MPNPREIRLAVLIDADNISSHHVQPLMEEVARYGVPTIKRIYGDWTKPNLSGWKPCLLDYAISPVQQFSYTAGKNSTDSALIIDAMDILYSEKVDGFCLVSSDSDFTRLATRLREAGKTVFGIGEQKTPNPFIAACDRFIFVEILQSSMDQEEDESVEKKVAAHGATPASMRESSKSRNGKRSIRKVDSALRRLIETSIEAVADDDGWAFLGEIGNLILKKQPSFDPRNFGYAKLSELMRRMDSVELDERPTNSNSKKVIHIYARLR